MVLANKVPRPVSNNQQKRTKEMVISLPWNWDRNSRIVISWTAMEDIPVPIMDQMIKRFKMFFQPTKFRNYWWPGDSCPHIKALWRFSHKDTKAQRRHVKFAFVINCPSENWWNRKKSKIESFPRKRESIMAWNDWIPAVRQAHGPEPAEGLSPEWQLTAGMTINRRNDDWGA